MSVYDTPATEFSNKYLELSVCLKRAKLMKTYASEDTLIKVLTCQKKLEKIYHKLSTEKTYDSTNLVPDFSVIQDAYSSSSMKTEKFVSKFTSVQSTDQVSTNTVTQLSPLADLTCLSTKQDHLFFGAIKSHPELSCLELDYPCEFEFGGIRYPSALHAFMAQTFHNNFDLQKQCALSSKDELLKLIITHGNQCPDWYLPTLKGEQYREKIMYHIQDAKFGQNQHLLKKLLATLDTALVYTSDLNEKQGLWGAGTEGNRPNQLGKVLMWVRERYHGIGEKAISERCRENLNKNCFKTQFSSLDKSDLEIESEIEKLNANASEEVYLSETKICKKSEHLSQNRFNEYNYVFDKTLVPLSTGGYINANFLYNGLVIASQTPMSNTAENFWQMVLEQHSKFVVMLNLPSDFTNFFYCPDITNLPKRFGNIEVRLLEEPTIETHPSWNQAPFEEEMHGFKIRRIEKKKNGITHLTTHIQYLNWRDLKIGSEGCLARIVSFIAAEQKNSNAPIVVHCLAGVGRTAVFALVYEQYLKWQQNQELDVYKSVTEQRDPKSGRYYKMVQSHEQYAFCYSSLRYIICKSKQLANSI